MTQDLKASFRTISKQNLAQLNNTKELFFDKKINILLQNIIINLLDNTNNKQKIMRFSQKKFQDMRFLRLKKLHLKTPKNILIYVPLNIEANIFPLIFYLKKQKNIKIFSPFIFKKGKNTNKTFKIVPFRLPLEKNKFNIFEAKDSHFSHFNDIDIAIVPILGLDCEFSRVGFGKGMFDRFYYGLKKKPINIFVSRILHFSNKKLGNIYDIKGDFIVASRGNKYDLRSDWIKYNNFSRPFILHRKEILHKRAETHHRTS